MAVNEFQKTTRILTAAGSTNPFTVGSGVNENISVIFDIGSGSNPRIRWQASENRFEVSEDGVNFYPLVNLNDLIKYSMIYGYWGD